MTNSWRKERGWTVYPSTMWPLAKTLDLDAPPTLKLSLGERRWDRSRHLSQHAFMAFWEGGWMSLLLYATKRQSKRNGIGTSQWGQSSNACLSTDGGFCSRQTGQE